MAEEETSLLVKFIDQQYINDFVDKGQIHFLTLNEINDLEKNGNDTQGDLYEGKTVNEFNPQKVNIYIKDIKNNKVYPIQYKSAEVSVTYSALQKRVIASFALLRTNDFYQTDSGYQIKESVVRGLESISGGRPCVLLPTFAFLEIVKTYTKQHGLGIHYRPITYKERSPSEAISYNKSDEEEIINDLAFTKRKKYVNQKEFRILINDEFEESANIKFGSLKKLPVIQLSGIQELRELIIQIKIE